MAPETLRIVLLDDGPDLLELYEAVIRTYPFPTHLQLFTNGLEALEAMTQKPPHLLVMDWNREFDNGDIMLKVLAKRGLTFPVLVASGWATDELVRQSVAPSQTVARLQKPFVCQDFLATVVSLLFQDRIAKPLMPSA